MAKWKVNEGTQVFFNGKLYESGDSFDASDDEAAPFAAWVTKGRASADTKAETSSPNKAQKSSANKSK